jgi:hypothetical protein
VASRRVGRIGDPDESIAKSGGDKMSGSRSMSAIPSFGPRTNTPLATASASTARAVTSVTLRQPLAGSPVAGSMMWWYRRPSFRKARS